MSETVRTAPPTRADLARVKPALVYWCDRGEWWLPLSDGPECPEEEPHRMRKRRMYLCPWCEDQGCYDITAYFDRAEFLAHHEDVGQQVQDAFVQVYGHLEPLRLPPVAP